MRLHTDRQTRLTLSLICWVQQLQAGSKCLVKVAMYQAYYIRLRRSPEVNKCN